MIARLQRVSRLLVMCGAVAALGVATSAHGKDADQIMAATPQSLQFAPIPSMPSCATAAIVRGNPRSGPAWVLLKLASGCRVPRHWHTPNEDLVIISGRGVLAMDDGPPLQFVPGAYASLPSHHIHQASCYRSCLLFSIADGAFDIHYVDASGEELSADRALQQPVVRTKKKKK